MGSKPTLFEDSDLSQLPASNPGSGKPWLDPTTGALIVGALGSFGLDASAVNALIASYAQPLDSDLSAIAALSTTAFGRALLALADAAAARAAIGAQAAITGDFTVNGFIDATQIRCDGSVVMDTTGTQLSIGVGGFTTVIITASGALGIPSGTTAQRPGTPTAGMFRWNADTVRHEFWNGSAWVNHVRLTGDTMTGNLTAPALIASQNISSFQYTTSLVANGNNLGGITTNTGMRLDANFQVAFAFSGTDRFRVTTDVLLHRNSGTVSAPVYSFEFATNTGMLLGGTSAGSRSIIVSTDGAAALTLGGSGTSRRATFAGPLLFPPYTFATVPSASASTGDTIRITDRSHRLATSDGTNWNWTGTTTPIS